jgi:hypothetical protein
MSNSDRVMQRDILENLHLPERINLEQILVLYCERIRWFSQVLEDNKKRAKLVSWLFLASQMNGGAVP